MNGALQQKPELLLTTGFLFGLVGGLLIAAWIIYIYWQTGKIIERFKRAIQRQKALKRLKEAIIEIDDERMMCAACWEERHPGDQWPLKKRAHCQEHPLSERRPAIQTESAKKPVYVLQ